MASTWLVQVARGAPPTALLGGRPPAPPPQGNSSVTQRAPPFHPPRPHYASRSSSAGGAESAPAAVNSLAIREDEGSAVDVEGEFPNWNQITMRRAANGVWYADLRVPAGQYRYAFRATGSEWRRPEGTRA